MYNLISQSTEKLISQGCQKKSILNYKHICAISNKNIKSNQYFSDGSIICVCEAHFKESRAPDSGEVLTTLDASVDNGTLPGLNRPIVENSIRVDNLGKVTYSPRNISAWFSWNLIAEVLIFRNNEKVSILFVHWMKTKTQDIFPREVFSVFLVVKYCSYN